MSGCYWDTSAILALLIDEGGSQRMRQLAFQTAGLPGWTSFYSLVEMESAFARRLKDGTLTEDLLPRMRVHAQKLQAALSLVWADGEILDDSRRLVFELGLRPGDALQLASARCVAKQEPKMRFASLDRKLSEAAAAAGLAVAAAKEL